MSLLFSSIFFAHRYAQQHNHKPINAKPNPPHIKSKFSDIEDFVGANQCDCIRFARGRLSYQHHMFKFKHLELEKNIARARVAASRIAASETHTLTPRLYIQRVFVPTIETHTHTA